MGLTPLSAAERALLELHRLEADLTYPQLADAIGVSTGALHNLMAKDSGITPLDRTVFKVRRYLGTVRRKAVSA